MSDLNSILNSKIDRILTKKLNTLENQLLKILKYYNFQSDFNYSIFFLSNLHIYIIIVLVKLTKYRLISI